MPGAKGCAGLKLTSVLAGMMAGADSIDDLDVLRHGAMGKLFGGVRAPSTLGTLLRSIRFGHVRQLDAVAARTLCRLADRVPGLLPDSQTSGRDPLRPSVRRRNRPSPVAGEEQDGDEAGGSAQEQHDVRWVGRWTGRSGSTTTTRSCVTRSSAWSVDAETRTDRVAARFTPSHTDPLPVVPSLGRQLRRTPRRQAD